MIIKVLYFFTFFFEMLVANIFFSGIFQRKKSLPATIGIGACIFEIGALVNVIFGTSIAFNVVFTYIALFLFSSVCFVIKKSKAAFYSAFLLALSSTVEAGIIFILSSLSKNYLMISETDTLLMMTEAIISKLLYFLATIIILRFMKNVKEQIKIPIVFYFFPLISSCSIISFWYICATQYIVYRNQIVLAIISFMLFITTIILFFSFQLYAQNETTIRLLQQQQNKIETDIQYYNILEKQNNDLRIYAHDAKKHLNIIRSLNANPEIDTYIKEMEQNLETYSRVSHSGNRYLDVILDKYLTECILYDIDFQYDVGSNNLTGIEQYDIVTILGNLLDNAVEGALRSKDKHITFETDFRNNYSVIIISNSCDISPQYDEEKNLITTKEQKNIHGIGIKSVKKAVKKLDGAMDIEYDEQKRQFTVTVILENKGNWQ